MGTSRYFFRTIQAFLLLVFLYFTPAVTGQLQQASEIAMPNAIWLEPQTDDFETIRQQAEAWFEGKEKGRGTGYKQWKRWEYFNERRLTPDGKVTNTSTKNWDAYMAYTNGAAGREITVTNGSWYTLGPVNWSNPWTGYNPGIGRVNCIAFHPTDPNTIWVGLPAGGLWKTTNHGTSWTSLTDGLPSIGVSGIVVNTSNTNIIYILTGDGDAGDTRSIGVLKTTNGGTTWFSTGLSYDVTDDVRGYKLIKHPTNNSILWAVMTNGLWRTTNSGADWTNMRTGSYRDLEFKPGDASIVYASSTSSFFRSVDGGDIWTTITSGLPTGETRIAIGVSPANSTYVYLLCGPGGSGGAGTFKGVYRSFDSGLNFGLKSTTPNILGGSNTGGGDGDQAWYDLSIAVSRTDVADMVTGGINIWRSLDFGSTWDIRSHWKTTAMPAGVDYVHADIHALEINPINNRLYVGCDGGIFWSDNFGTDWYDISSGLGPTQWYKISGFESNPSLIIGGTQDNGSNKYTGSTTITHMLGADGMDCAISHANSNTFFSMQQDGALFRSTNGGSSFSYIQPAGSTGSWVTPVLMDPTNANILYIGYSDVYRTANGGTIWTNLGSDGRGELAMGTNNTAVIYASVGSTLQRTANTGSSWTTISGGLPALTITGIAVDPQASNQVWVCVGGFSNGQKVYFTPDASASPVVWTNVTGSLPNTIMNCIVTDNGLGTDNVLYVGTDIGVFYRDATLSDWVPFSNWLPVVPVFDLEINNTSALITAGTFGRGLWRSQTYTSCVPSWTLSGGAAPGYSYYQASNFINSTRVFNEGIGQEGIFKAANQITLLPGFNVTGGSKFKAMLGACGAGIPGFDAGTISGTYAGPMPGIEE